MKEINIYFSKENNAINKLIFKILPAVILLVGVSIVLGGCEEEKQMKVIYPAVNLPMSVVTFFEKHYQILTQQIVFSNQSGKTRVFL